MDRGTLTLKCLDDGEITTEVFDSLDAMLHQVSFMHAFSDCDDSYQIVNVLWGTREIRYMGWQPGMKFEYYWADNGESMWVNYYPNWDH